MWGNHVRVSSIIMRMKLDTLDLCMSVLSILYVCLECIFIGLHEM